MIKWEKNNTEDYVLRVSNVSNYYGVFATITKGYLSNLPDSEQDYYYYVRVNQFYISTVKGLENAKAVAEKVLSEIIEELKVTITNFEEFQSNKSIVTS